MPLFKQPHDWGFHIYAIGVYMMEHGLAADVEFWNYADRNSISFHSNGVLRVLFLNEADVASYVEELGVPDLFINYGSNGTSILQLLEGRSFRVHVPCLRNQLRHKNEGAECYLVDSEEYLDSCSMLYIPVVNTVAIHPGDCEKLRDFIYLASFYAEKRHDILLNAVRGTKLTGHLHPVDGSLLSLSGTRITTSKFNEANVPHLLQTSRIAVYPGENTSNPAAMWECVAADLPIVVNSEIAGGKHVVVPGVTGELASPAAFLHVMKDVLQNRESYRPRQYFEANWNTTDMLHKYLDFFSRMGFSL